MYRRDNSHIDLIILCFQASHANLLNPITKNKIVVSVVTECLTLCKKKKVQTVELHTALLTLYDVNVNLSCLMHFSFFEVLILTQ